MTESDPIYCAVCGAELDPDESHELHCQRCRHHDQTEPS